MCILEYIGLFCFLFCQLKPVSPSISGSQQSSTASASTTVITSSTSGTALVNPIETKEFKLHEYSIHLPQHSDLSISSAQRTSHRSHSSESELQQKLCDCSNRSAKISQRHKRITRLRGATR